MTIRPALPDDVPAVLDMVQKEAAFHESLAPAKYPYRPGVTEMYRGWLTQRAGDARSAFFVADAAGRAEAPRPVGFIVGTVEREIPIYRLSEFGFVHDLWVDPDYRHEGVGRQLVMHAIERFAQIGVRQVRLDVVHNNPAARALFEQCGFKPSTMEMLVELSPVDGSGK
jgi:ribosomal protein S18 acetylase RimI-like enzyme